MRGSFSSQVPETPPTTVVPRRQQASDISPGNPTPLIQSPYQVASPRPSNHDAVAQVPGTCDENRTSHFPAFCVSAALSMKQPVPTPPRSIAELIFKSVFAFARLSASGLPCSSGQRGGQLGIPITHDLICLRLASSFLNIRGASLTKEPLPMLNVSSQCPSTNSNHPNAGP